MADKDNKIYWIAGLTLLVIIMLPYIGMVPKFAITEADIILTKVDSILPETDFDAFSTINSTAPYATVSFNYSDVISTYPNNKILYLVDEVKTLYDSIPTLAEGTHTIRAYRFYAFNNTDVDNLTYIDVHTGSKTFYNAITTVEVPKEVIKYMNNTVYVNQTINETITVEKLVEKDLTFIQKYGIAGIIFVVMGLIIIYLIYKRTR